MQQKKPRPSGQVREGKPTTVWWLSIHKILYFMYQLGRATGAQISSQISFWGGWCQDDVITGRDDIWPLQLKSYSLYREGGPKPQEDGKLWGAAVLGGQRL